MAEPLSAHMRRRMPRSTRSRHAGQLLPEETLLMNAARTQAATAAVETLTALSPGMSLPYGGNKFTRVPDQVAAAFQPGDHLLVVQTDGAILHIPAAQHGLVAQAVAHAQAAFVALRAVSDAQIEGFYDALPGACKTRRCGRVSPRPTRPTWPRPRHAGGRPHACSPTSACVAA